jgi:hypothetical protein
MARIKSTLDLVMERTRNISLSEEDKEALQKKEMSDKVRGWVGMFLDRRITIPELKREFTSESSRHGELKDIMRTELLDHIDPDAENSSILEALAEVLGLDVKPFEDSIKDYHDRYELHRQEHRERVLSKLKADGISGKAVIPNTDKNESWIAHAKGLKDQFKQKIRAL